MQLLYGFGLAYTYCYRQCAEYRDKTCVLVEGDLTLSTALDFYLAMNVNNPKLNVHGVDFSYSYSSLKTTVLIRVDFRSQAVKPFVQVR